MEIQEGDIMSLPIGLSRRLCEAMAPELMREFVEISTTHADGRIDMSTMLRWRPEHTALVSSSIKENLSGRAALTLRGQRWEDFRSGTANAILDFDFSFGKMLCLEAAALFCALPEEVVGVNSLREFLSARSIPKDMTDRVRGVRKEGERDLFTLAHTVSYLYEVNTNKYMRVAHFAVVSGLLDAVSMEAGRDGVVDSLCSAVDPAISVYVALLENAGRIAKGENPV
jgi:hypothetical protein